MKTALMQKIAKDLEKATEKPVTKPEGSGKVGKDMEAVSDKPAKKEDTKGTAKDDKPNEHKTDKSRKAEDNDLVASIKRSLQYRMGQLNKVTGDVKAGAGDVLDKVEDVAGDVKDSVKDAGHKVKDFVQKHASKKKSFLAGYMNQFTPKGAFKDGYLKTASDDKKPSLAGDIGIGAGGLVGAGAGGSGGMMASAALTSPEAVDEAAQAAHSAKVQDVINKHIASPEYNAEALTAELEALGAGPAGEALERNLARLGRNVKIGVGTGAALPVALASYLIAKRHMKKHAADESDVDTDEKPSLSGDLGVAGAGAVAGAGGYAGTVKLQDMLARRKSPETASKLDFADKAVADLSATAPGDSAIAKAWDRGKSHIAWHTAKNAVRDAALAAPSEAKVLGMNVPAMAEGLSKGLRYGAAGLPMALAAYLIAKRHTDQ